MRTEWVLRIVAGAALALVAAALVFANISAISPDAALPGAAEDLSARLILLYSYYPRLFVAVLAGAALGLSGVLFQQILQNPLASADTLAVSAGARLAMTIGILVAPAFHARHPELLALAGAFAAWLIIAAAAFRRRDDPLTLILTGFIVSFALGAVASLLMVLHQEYLTSLFVWGAGSLAQGDWESVRFLALRLAVCGIIAALLAKPLLILGFGDQPARSLGVSLALVRPVLLALAVFLSSSVVASVGVIAFVGLAAPHIARLAGAQKLGARLLAAPAAGATLVLVIDQTVQFVLDDRSALLPTGAVTALLGAPLMIWLLRRIPAVALEGIGRNGNLLARGSAPMDAATGLRLAAAAGLLLVVLTLALLVGRAPSGLTFGLDLAAGALDWRIPRVMAAAGAGLGLGLAGCLVQRLFANPMASPEVLGVGGGVAIGLIAALMVSADAGYGLQFAGATAGALSAMGLLMLLGGQRGFPPQRLLLIGIAVTALLDAAVILFLTLGDPRSAQVLAWLSGSTYRVTPELAVGVVVVSLAALAATMPLSRWLDILPLGRTIATGLGVPLAAARPLVLFLSALATAAAALIVGPMSFVGLLAPHLASLLCLRRAAPQLLGSALLGAALVTFADWAGRIVFAPTELPAGLLSVLIGTAVIAAGFAVLKSGDAADRARRPVRPSRGRS